MCHQTDIKPDCNVLPVWRRRILIGIPNCSVCPSMSGASAELWMGREGCAFARHHSSSDIRTVHTTATSEKKGEETRWWVSTFPAGAFFFLSVFLFLVQSSLSGTPTIHSLFHSLLHLCDNVLSKVSTFITIHMTHSSSLLCSLVYILMYNKPVSDVCRCVFS